MTEIIPEAIVAIVSAVVGALLAGVAYLLKRKIEKNDSGKIEEFISGYERLHKLYRAEPEDKVSAEELAAANRIVESAQGSHDSLLESGEHLTQADMNRISLAQLTAADAQLSVVYEELMSFQDGARAEALDYAMESWRKFRHDFAAFEAEFYRGGSIQSLIYAANAEARTNEFIRLLSEQLEFERNK
ncbi:lysozyme inhibitor LprI family protein [Pseudomonas jilinensis]|uniref:Lysozyme inhibitor LprI-like N-terminal domain-containing protein n=1 Tax=Pseudomonas jilinensis TaxID=2078689 RepID=A0A396RS54_9PSED|nr:lysozyme inhibitor LprI family protein [Pseudomonas jilinensis]RHW19504.1 hypothetical protein C2846_18485 [Pseudomonas jilinensis]